MRDSTQLCLFEPEVFACFSKCNLKLCEIILYILCSNVFFRIFVICCFEYLLLGTNMSQELQVFYLLWLKMSAEMPYENKLN